MWNVVAQSLINTYETKTEKFTQYLILAQRPTTLLKAVGKPCQKENLRSELSNII